jgi:hypothetical protein
MLARSDIGDWKSGRVWSRSGGRDRMGRGREAELRRGGKEKGHTGNGRIVCWSSFNNGELFGLSYSLKRGIED